MVFNSEVVANLFFIHYYVLPYTFPFVSQFFEKGLKKLNIFLCAQLICYISTGP